MPAEDLKAFEVQIAEAVVAGDLAFLEKAYAADFVFTHGTGKVQDKAAWLKRVEEVFKAKACLARTLEDQTVEMHQRVAITTGKLTVKRTDKDSYWVKYVRVYERWDNAWVMLSHRTMDHAVVTR